MTRLSGKNKKINVLIVEDSPTQAAHLKLILENKGYKVSVASNGKEALSILETTPPKLVISDIVMPEMDGYELCRTIKQDERFKQIPVILVTVLYDPQDVIRGLECGANNFISKPYDEKYLLSRIEIVLASSYAEETEKVQIGLDISFAGKKHHISASRLQILNMLLSTYETAVQKNHELTEARDQLRELNEHLEDLVEERTLQLENTNRQLLEEIEVRKKAEEALQRKTRAYQVISECNQFLVRTQDEQDLINGICNILVTSGGYRCAWVGYARDDKNKTVEPVAQFGFEKEYLNNLQISWKKGRHGKGPTSNAIRTRNPIVIHDIPHNPKYGSWSSEAVRRDYSTVAALPINIKGHVIGALTMYTADADAFDPDEMQLLSEMADDLSFGIESIRDLIKHKEAEQQISYLSSFPAKNPNPILELDEQGAILYANEAAKESIRKIIGNMVLSQFNPIDIGKLLEELSKGRSDTEIREVFIGDHMFIETLVLDPEFKTLRIYARDITERKKAEETLIASEVRYRRFFEAVRDGILILDAETGVIVDVNPFLIELLGFSHEQFLGKKIWEIGIFGDIAANIDKFKELQRKEYIHYEDLPLETADGRWINVEFVSFIYQVEHQKMIQCNIRDITERKLAEKALQESDARFRELADSITDVFFATDKDLRYTYWNKASEELTGIPAQDAIGKSIVKIFPDTPETRRAVEIYQDVLKTKQPRNFENEYNLGGKRFYLDISVYPTAGGIAVITTDITERKRAEEALRNTEARLNTILQSSPIPKFVIDNNHQVISWNKALEEISGIRAEQVLGTTRHWMAFYQQERPCMADLIVDGSIDKIPEIYKDKFQKSPLIEGSYEAIDFFPHIGGKGMWLHFVAAPIRDLAGTVIGAVETLEDITRLKEGEEALRESEKRYRNVVEDQTEFICRFLPDGMHLFANEAYCSYFGKTCDLVINTQFKPTIPQQDRQIVKEHFASLTRQHPIATIEHRIVMQDGQIRWQQWNDRAIFDKNGKVLEYQSVGRDITEKKLSEEALEELTNKLEQRVTERTDALMHLNEEMLVEIANRKDVERQLQRTVSEKETLLKEIHHRVKNNLQIIASLLNLQSQYIKDEQTLAVIKDSQNRIKAMALIHEKIYQSKSLDRIDYGDYLEKITRSLFESYGISPKKIVMKIHAKNILLHIDKAIPCSLILNELLSNSFKHAFPKDRTGEIRIDVKLGGDTLRLLYSDNGVGLPESVTLDRTESLGMRLISGLTQQLKGTIEIQRGGGTTFVIVFNV
jgi:PAS domain S-box-containing protein